VDLTKRGWGRRHWLPLIHRKPLPLGDVGPVVTFSFDDFPRTAYTEGGRLLKEYGARGTYYAAPGLMNSTTPLGEHFLQDDLYSLVGEGHELASHTYHHISSHASSVSEFLCDVREGYLALRRCAGGMVSRNFAYPQGAVTVQAKAAVGIEMLSCRGNYHGVNGRIVDLSLLRANPLYSSTGHADSIVQLIETNEAVRGWLIFYTHDVCAFPSQYGCTPSLLETAIKSALARSMAIMTVADVLTSTSLGKSV